MLGYCFLIGRISGEALHTNTFETRLWDQCIEARLKGKCKFEKDTTVYDCVLAASEAWLLRIVSVSEGCRLLGSSAMYLHLKFYLLDAQELFKLLYMLIGSLQANALPTQVFDDLVNAIMALTKSLYSPGRHLDS